uniref:Uncharacterized protein n=1 Tax=Anguilla anguilla TaxID=7936 RepID=A0A0E9PJ04_ANGAN
MKCQGILSVSDGAAPPEGDHTVVFLPDNPRDRAARL